MTNKITNEVRWGIIGAGDVSEIKSGPGFQLTPNSKIIAIMLRNVEKASDFVNGHILYVDGGILATIGKPSNEE